MGFLLSLQTKKFFLMYFQHCTMYSMDGYIIYKNKHHTLHIAPTYPRLNYRVGI